MRKSQTYPLVFSVALIFGMLAVSLTAEEQSRLSDVTIKSVIEYRLHEKGLKNVQVFVDDHVVTLSGSVRSLAEKRRAEQAARSAPDISGVENKLTINGPQTSDQEMAREMGRSIRSHPFFDIFDWIEGEVKNGEVTLRGWVRESWRKKEYERLAEDIAGTTKINNLIEVLPVSSFDDQIRISAARAIYGDPRFVRYANRSLPPIHVIVDNGRITLKGAVATQMEKQLAEMLVRTEVTSFEVVNELAVDSGKG